jgi:hypothetical protein
MQYQVKDFNVSLDLDVENRWKHVLEENRKEISQSLGKVKMMFNYFERKVWAKAILRSRVFYREVFEEIEFASDYLEEELESLLLFNVLVDYLYSGSVFVISLSDLRVVTGITLDSVFPLFSDLVPIQLSFYRSNDLIYHSITFPGIFGFLSAIKLGKFAINISSRQSSIPSQLNIQEENFNTNKNIQNPLTLWHLIQILSGRRSTSTSCRWALETLESYEDVLLYLQSLPLLHPSYITLTGLTQGAVITHAGGFISDIHELNEETWLIVQGYSDHWLPPSGAGDLVTLSKFRLTQIGQEYLNEELVLRLLTLKPSLNPLTRLELVLCPGSSFWFGTRFSESD